MEQAKMNELVKEAQAKFEELKKQVLKELEEKLDEAEKDAAKEEPKKEEKKRDNKRRLVTIGYDWDEETGTVVGEPKVMWGSNSDVAEASVAIGNALAEAIKIGVNEGIKNEERRISFEDAFTAVNEGMGYIYTTLMVNSAAKHFDTTGESLFDKIMKEII